MNICGERLWNSKECPLRGYAAGGELDMEA